MKKRILLFLSVLMMTSLVACGKKPADSAEGTVQETAAETATETITEWTREGYFIDKDNNFLSVLASDEEEYPGWYVGCMLGDDDTYGWYIQQEGNALHGNIVPEYEEGEFIVTVTEEGKDGVMLAVEGGETYHFTPYDMPEAAISVTINVEGFGNIAYAEGEEMPEIDKEYPFQSASVSLEQPATYTIYAYPKDGWKFVKWMRNGEDYTTEAKTTMVLSESADFIAVFEQDEAWTELSEKLSGEYVSGNMHANVNIIDTTVFASIERKDSDTAQTTWNIMHDISMDTRTVEYNDGFKNNATLNSDGDIEEDVLEYDNGVGTIVFSEDGTSFIWNDETSGMKDITFERIKN